MVKYQHNLCKCGKKKYRYAKQCQKCYTKTLKGKGNPMYGTHRYEKDSPGFIDGRTLKKYYCENCKIEISYRATRCGSCEMKRKLKEGILNNIGENNPTYRKEGSIRISSEGYRFIKVNNGWIQEHRYFVEVYIGRKLILGEVVHHIDGNILNNKLNNLYVFPKIGLHVGFENLLRYNLIDRFSIKSNLKILALNGLKE